MNLNMFKLNRLGMCVAVFMLSACAQVNTSSSSGAPVVSILDRASLGTCDRRNLATINLCTEAVGSDYDEPGYLSILQSSCESSSGVFSNENCDPTASFGTCVVGAKQANLTYVTYYPPQYTAASAEVACEDLEGIYMPLGK